MKKISFKMILIGLVCLTLLPVYPVIALEDDNLLENSPVTEKHYKTSEYGAILEKIKTINIKNARSLNKNDKELIKLLKERNDYQNYIYDLKELPENELATMNFNNTQINAIKTFDGTDEKATRASAYISATLRLTSFYYTASTNRTTASATFSGKWVGTPLYKMQDTTAIGMVGSLSRFVKTSSSNAITHYDGSVVRNTLGEYQSSAGQSYKFGICDINARIMKSFTMTYTAQADGKNTLMDYGAAYVHFKETFSLTGVSIGVSGTGASIGISFSWSKSADLEWKNVYPQSSYI